MLDPDDDISHPSLWRDLVDGRAGVGIRILIALLLAAFLVGAGLLLSYGLASIVPYWNRTYYYQQMSPGMPVSNAVYPRDELIAMVMLTAGAFWLGAVLWLFFKHTRRQALLRPIIYSVCIIAATIFLGVMAEESLRGDQEYVIAGLVLVAGAWVVLIWIQGFRRASAARPLRNRQDKHLDVRCPECGYRMVGLHESRCPECGRSYTLDELIARQDFRLKDVRTTSAPPPPPPDRSNRSDPGIVLES